MKRKDKEYIGLTVAAAWIPLSILAFYLSPVELYVKVLVAAAVSFLTFLFIILKEGD